MQCEPYGMTHKDCAFEDTAGTTAASAAGGEGPTALSSAELTTAQLSNPSSPSPSVKTQELASIQPRHPICDHSLFLPGNKPAEVFTTPKKSVTRDSFAKKKLVTPKDSERYEEFEVGASLITKDTQQFENSPIQKLLVEPLPLLDISPRGNRLQAAATEESSDRHSAAAASSRGVTDEEASMKEHCWAPWHEDTRLENEFTRDASGEGEVNGDDGEEIVDDDGKTRSDWATIDFQETFVPLFPMDSFTPEPFDEAAEQPIPIAATAEANFSASLCTPAIVSPVTGHMPSLHERKKPRNVDTQLRRGFAQEAWPGSYSAASSIAAERMYAQSYPPAQSVFAIGKDAGTTAKAPARNRLEGFNQGSVSNLKLNGDVINNSFDSGSGCSSSSMDRSRGSSSTNGSTSPVSVARPRVLRPLSSTTKVATSTASPVTSAATGAAAPVPALSSPTRLQLAPLAPAISPGGATGAATKAPKELKQVAVQNGAAFELRDSMPPFKRQPVGKTGVRFVIEHNFVTASGTWYNGYSMQFPKVFGLGAEKCK